MNEEQFCRYISNLAVKALICEVSAAPKPGLVDRYNSGAHDDMDFFTFINSSFSLAEYFYKCTFAGFEFSGENYSELFNNLRVFGIEAEYHMLAATGNVNTHKGIVFSFGIITAAAGICYKKYKSIKISAYEISNIVKLLAGGITDELKNVKEKSNLTYGEDLYLKYGIKGIRGEAESGFETVLMYSLPEMKKLIKKRRSINDLMVQILLNLMVNTEDSNILGRHDLKTLNYVKNMAESALDYGGYFTSRGKQFVKEMDRIFIEKNISPGGSADLTAVTVMLFFLENGNVNF